jgi:hypothetical protein
MKSIPKFHIFKAKQTDLVQKFAKSMRNEPEREEREREIQRLNTKALAIDLHHFRPTLLFAGQNL